MIKLTNKKGLIIKVLATFCYILSVCCICAGIVGVKSTQNNSFESKKTINNNIKKTVSTKELMTSFQTITARIEAEKKAKAEAEAKAKKAKEEAEARKAAAALGTTVPKSELQQYAHDLVINSYGWTESDFSALVKLWNSESGWNANSHSSTGAHGIPQALPASKMSSEGSDYYSNGKTQIRWGLKYINNKYGNAADAWTFFKNNGWY